MEDNGILSEPFPIPTKSTTTRINISVPVDADGNPDWTRASDKVKKKFREVIENPATKSEFTTQTTQENVLSDEQAQQIGMMMIEGLFKLQSAVAVARKKCTAEQAKEIFDVNFDQWPGFQGALTRTLQKRGPEWLAEFGDEIYVGSVIVMASLGCWTKVEAVQAKAKEKPKEEKKVEPIYNFAKVEA
jgi:hypothetical protein